MPVEFVNRLSQGQIIDLINFSCYRPFPTVNRVTVSNKLDETSGRQYLKVNAWTSSKVVGTFFIDDFTLHCFSNGTNGYHNEELRDYMASIFGREYIEALRLYYDREIERLENQLGISRR